MQTKWSDVLTAVFLAPVALIFGVMLAAVFIPLVLFITLALLVVLPFVIVDSVVCHAMGWPDWSARQKRWKAIGDASVRPEHAGLGDTPSSCGCGPPCLPSELSCTITPGPCEPLCPQPDQCPTCDARADNVMAMMQRNQPLKNLGTAWCPDCGEEFVVYAEGHDAEAH